MIPRPVWILALALPGAFLPAQAPATSRLASPGRGPTAEALVDLCLEAMGGKERIQAIRTLRVTRRLGDGQSQRILDVARPNRYRSGAPGEDLQLVFDGQRICAWGELMIGDAPGPKLLVEPDEPKDFDIDLALIIPPIFEYPSTYEGLEEVEGARFHRLRVLSPHGVEMITFLDARTFLPTRLQLHFTKGGVTWNNVRLFSDFKRVDGLLYPHTTTSVSAPTRHATRVERIEFNPAFPADHFRIPDEARARVDAGPARKAALVVDRCTEAMGGKARLESLRTLRVTTAYEGHGNPVVQEWTRPMGTRFPGSGVNFDGRRAWRESAKEEEARFSDPVFLQHCELDVAFLFPLFLHFTPVYEGRNRVGDRLTHILKVELPLGTTVTYFVDARTYLPVKIVGPASAAGGNPFQPERIFSGFQPADGWLFPRRFSFTTPAGQRQASVERVEVNPGS